MANIGPYTPQVSWMDEKPNKLAESKLDAGQQEHIYETASFRR